MPGILRILSKDNLSGSLETRLVYLKTISEVMITMLPHDEPPEVLEGEDSGEDQINIDGSLAAEYGSIMLRLKKTDGTEEDIDILERTYNFDIRDENGEIVCMTEDPFELETGLIIADMDMTSDRRKAVEKFKKEQTEKKRVEAEEKAKVQIPEKKTTSAEELLDT